MNRTIIKLIFLGLTVLSTCACQQMNEQRSKYIRDRGQDYLSSTLTPPLKVPDDLDYPSVTQSFPIPENPPLPGQVTSVCLVPPGFGELPQQ